MEDKSLRDTEIIFEVPWTTTEIGSPHPLLDLVLFIPSLLVLGLVMFSVPLAIAGLIVLLVALF